LDEVAGMASLVRQFEIASLAATGVFWLTLGNVSGVEAEHAIPEVLISNLPECIGEAFAEIDPQGLSRSLLSPDYPIGRQALPMIPRVLLSIAVG
jgi:hypothetical protein